MEQAPIARHWLTDIDTGISQLSLVDRACSNWRRDCLSLRGRAAPSRVTEANHTFRLIVSGRIHHDRRDFLRLRTSARYKLNNQLRAVTYFCSSLRSILGLAASHDLEIPIGFVQDLEIVDHSILGSSDIRLLV